MRMGVSKEGVGEQPPKKGSSGFWSRIALDSSLRGNQELGACL